MLWYGGLCILGVLVGFCLLLWVLDRWGLKAELKDAERFVKVVMRGGSDGARMRYRRVGTLQSVDVVKRIPPGGRTSCQIVIHSGPCTTAQFEGAERALRSNAIEYSAEERSGGRRRLIIECDNDLEKALLVLRTIFVDGFGVPPDAMFRAGMAGVIDVRQGASHGWEEERPGNR
jgi:hypothetical protein